MDNYYKHVILVLLFICGFVSNSYSQQLSTDIKTLSRGAEVVLDGKVIKQNSYWNTDKTRIYTNATIQVDEYIKGNTNESTVIVTYLGGEVGDVGELYTHMPRFENDEEVLVFLRKDQSTSNYKVFNGEEGKLSIVYDKNTGEKVTSSNMKISSLKSQIKSFVNE